MEENKKKLSGREKIGVTAKKVGVLKGRRESERQQGLPGKRKLCGKGNIMG